MVHRKPVCPGCRKMGRHRPHITLFILSLGRSGERAGRLAERLENREKANEIQRRMLEAASRRPHDRDELAERLRDGRF